MLSCLPFAFSCAAVCRADHLAGLSTASFWGLLLIKLLICRVFCIGFVLCVGTEHKIDRSFLRRWEFRQIFVVKRKPLCVQMRTAALFFYFDAFIAVGRKVL